MNTKIIYAKIIAAPLLTVACFWLIYGSLRQMTLNDPMHLISPFFAVSIVPLYLAAIRDFWAHFRVGDVHHPRDDLAEYMMLLLFAGSLFIVRIVTQYVLVRLF